MCQNSARRRRFHSPRRSLEKTRLQGNLQAIDGLRDRRLRHMHGTRRRADAAALHNPLQQS
jgi:hypothetical protein